MSFAIIGVVTILFIVFAILSAKSWHWVNIVFLVLTYLAGVGAVIGAAQVLQLRSKEVSALIKSEKTLETVTKQVEEALYGTSDSNEFSADSILGPCSETSKQSLILALLGSRGGPDRRRRKFKLPGKN